MASKLSGESEGGYPIAVAHRELSQLFICMLHHQLHDIKFKSADPRRSVTERRDESRIEIGDREMISNAIERSVERIMLSELRSELQVDLLLPLMSGFILLWTIQDNESGVPDSKYVEDAVKFSSCRDIRSKMLYHSLKLLFGEVPICSDFSSAAFFRKTILSLLGLLISKWDADEAAAQVCKSSCIHICLLICTYFDLE